MKSSECRKNRIAVYQACMSESQNVLVAIIVLKVNTQASESRKNRIAVYQFLKQL